MPRISISRMSIPIGLCILAIGAAAFLSGCSKNNEKPAVASQSKSEPKSEFAVSVKVAPVVRASIKSTINAVGAVMALNQAKVSAKIPGKLEEVLVEEGDRVKAGQTLAKLEKTDFVLTRNQAEAAVAMAEANFSKAKTDWARARELFEKGIASQQQFDLAKSGFDVAEAAVKQAKADMGLAQNQLDNANVTAPFAGTVTHKYCCLGERVAPGQPLLEVADISTVDIEVGVSDKRFSDVKLGQSATIIVDGYPDMNFTGKVKKVQPSIDAATRTFKVTIGIANPQELLKPGMFARANIVVDFHQDALVVPKAALLEEEGKYLVVAVRGGRIKRLDTVPGFVETDKVEILSGPSEGEQVVIEGAYGLAQDALVKVSGE